MKAIVQNAYGDADALRLGADHVIDYTTEDFVDRSETLDLIFDNVGNHSFTQLRRVLAPLALTALIDAGKLTTVIDRTYRLEETPEAITYVGAGHARGKVVILVTPDAEGA